MGFFPFFRPLDLWAVDEMQRREDNLISTTFRTPWATIISSALVVKADVKNTTEPDEQTRVKKLQDIIGNGGNGLDSYSGCIISNNINNIELSYSTQESIVGIDFNGKPIKVVGETGRKIPTPIINSIDIDTDGSNNTLKTAKVNVTCFSLKQFELFEMFFMKPGMNVMVEWGDNSLLMYDKFQLKSNTDTSNTNKPVTNTTTTNKTGEQQTTDRYKRPEEAMVISQDGNDRYDTFCENFSKYFRSDTDALTKYLNRIERARGSYDLVAGKVLQYSFSVNADGTYSVNFEVSQGNQMTQWLPKNSTKGGPTSTEATPGIEVTDKDTIIKKMTVDFNLNEKVFKTMLDKPHPEGHKDWMHDWFNFIKINKEQKDTIASSTPYISLRFILWILANYSIKEVQTQSGNVDHFFMLKIPKWKTGKIAKTAEEKYIIPCNSNKFIFSSNDQIIYPLSTPPKFQAPAYSKNKDGKTQLKDPGVENKISITSDTGDSTKIGPYEFHINEPQLQHLYTKIGPIEVDASKGRRLGNALNIFLNYNTVLNYWNRAYTRKDFLDQVLNLCNNNSYGLFQLVYGNMGTDGSPIEGPTVLDIKFKGFDSFDPKKDEKTYRFKPTTINSIVKDFSFNFDMGNLIAGRTLFNSSKFLEESIKNAKQNANQTSANTNQSKQDNKSQTETESIPLPPDAYKSVDNSTFGNADGWYSINKVELKTIEKKWEQALKVDKEGGALSETPNTDQNKQTTNEVQDLNEVIKNKSIFFLLGGKTDKDKKMLIYKDNPLIQGVIEVDNKKTKSSTVSPITVTLTIDGFSGFSTGQYFNIDGIPEIYNQLGIFQITNIKHNVSKDGWTTTIEAEHNIVNKK